MNFTNFVMLLVLKSIIPDGIIPFLKLAVIQSKLYAFEHIKLKILNEIVFAICFGILYNRHNLP